MALPNECEPWVTTIVGKLDANLLARLRYIALKAGVPRQDCADVVQAVATDALRQLRDGRFRGDSSLSTWVYQILRGKIADYWDSRRRAQRMSPHESFEASSQSAKEHLLDVILGPPQNPDITIAVRQTLSQLSSFHRLVLVLNLRYGYRTKEIAARLKRPEGTIGRVLAQAKNQFREIYKGEDPKAVRRLMKGVGDGPKNRD